MQFCTNWKHHYPKRIGVLLLSQTLLINQREYNVNRMDTVLRLHFVKLCIILNLVVIQYSPYRSPPVSSSRLNSGSMLGSRRREGASVRSRTVSTQRHYSFYSSSGIACRNESDVVNEICAQDNYRYYHVI